MYACIPDDIPAFATSCVTSLAGSLLLLAAFHKRAFAALRKNGRSLILGSLLLSILNTFYNTMYLYGLKSFDVTSGSFTFCMTVVVLPVVLLSARRKISLETWISVLLVCMGISIALGPSLKGEQLPGLAVMTGGCLLRAIFIVILADMAKKHEPLSIAIFLGLFAGLFSMVFWFFQDTRLFFGLPITRTLIASWAIYSYFIVAISQAFNIIAMKYVTATNATVVYSLEIVFSITWGTIMPPNVITPVKLTAFTVIGAALIIAGSLAEILDLRGKRNKLENLTQKEST